MEVLAATRRACHLHSGQRMIPSWEVPARDHRRGLRLRSTHPFPSRLHLPTYILLLEIRQTSRSRSGKTSSPINCFQTAPAFRTFRHRKRIKALILAEWDRCRAVYLRRSSSTVAVAKATATATASCPSQALLRMPTCGRTTLILQDRMDKDKARIVGAQVQLQDSPCQLRSTLKIGEFYLLIYLDTSMHIRS